MNKTSEEKSYARNEQVINFETSSDTGLTAQVCKFTTTGAGGKVMAQGYEVALTANDEEAGQTVVCSLTSAQTRKLAIEMLSMANYVNIKNAEIAGAKFPF